MTLPLRFSFMAAGSPTGEERGLSPVGTSVDLATLLPGASADAPWEVEVGFGKGRFLLAAAAANPERRYLGVEVAGDYYRLARDRGRRRGLANLVLVHGEAELLLATVVPAACAARVHVYFPDPWPKTRHHKRRLFDPETVDLLLRLLRPDGELLFATDHLDYGTLVEEILAAHPAVELARHEGPWPGGARTNYEAKYMAEGRPIRRLVVRLRPAISLLHPAGRVGLLVAPPLAGVVAEGD